MLLDIGVGILLGLWLGPDSIRSTNVWFGIIFALLPDSDVLFYFALKKSKLLSFRSHRELLHFPLLYLLVGVMLVAVLSPKWLPLFIAASTVHFIHDSVGIGWGIPLFYPLYNKYFKFFYQYDLKLAGIPQKSMWIWSRQEQNKLIDKYRDPHWSSHIFLHPIKYVRNWRLLELAIFIIAMIILLIH